MNEQKQWGKPREVVLEQPSKQDAYEQANEKKGFFNREKKSSGKEFPPSTVDSETTWREVNLFMPETIGIVATVIAGVILMFLVGL